MANTSNADQIAYWNGDVGQRWAAQQQRLDEMLSDISAETLKTAGAKRGERVLDIGCGCGDSSLKLADSVGGDGRVVGLDISTPMLARAKARAAGKPQLSFLQDDAATHRFEPVFDLLFSRFGVMFFADPAAAFANLRRALKPGGRVAFVCWREPRENEWVRVPLGAIAAHAPPATPPQPGEPGPFAFADPERVRRILTTAGFADVALRPFETMMQLGATLEDAVADIQEFGPVSRALAEATPAQKAAAAAALREALAPFAKIPPVRLGGAVWIVTARNGGA